MHSCLSTAWFEQFLLQAVASSTNVADMNVTNVNLDNVNFFAQI